MREVGSWGSGRAIWKMRHTKEGRFLFVLLIIAVVFLAACAIVPAVLPFDANYSDLSSAFLAPGEEGHIMGTDSIGRDVFLRTLAGGGESVLVSLVIVAIALVIGVAVGLISGFSGGNVDAVFTKVITMFQAFPSFVLAIAIAAILGRGTVNMIVAIVLVYWTSFARLSRSLAMSLKESDSVRAARVCGAGTGSIVRRYLLPAVAGSLLVAAALAVGDVILTMAGLSFLGLGPAQPTNEWGAMVSDAVSSFQFAPWGIICPSIALLLAVAIFNLLGDALRDFIDVRSHAFEAVPPDSAEPKTGRFAGKKKGDSMKGKKRGRKVVTSVLAVVMTVGLAFPLAGCNGTTTDTPANGEGTLTAGSTGYFYNETLDPANNWDGWELEYYGVAENLLKLTDDFETEPWIAQSVENVDEYTWKITLRDDVTFSNGKKVTGELVKACLERTFEENPRASETLDMKSIEADGQIVTVTTNTPVPSFKNIICDPLFCIYYTEDGIDYANDGTACTGPYTVTDFEYEDHITLAPNENYWNGTPKLKEITLKTYLDPDAMTLAMQNGELDVIAMPPASAYQVLDDTSQYEVLSTVSTRADFIRFNMKHAVVANDAVRLAISYCIDREGYADSICAGTATASYGVYSETLPYGGTDGLDVTVTEMDLDAAKKVLDDAGCIDTDGDGVRELPDGTPIEINLYNCSSYERFVDLANDLQNKLSSVGIKLNITTVDYWLQDTETYNKDNPDMTIDSYGMAPTGDADYFASMCFATDGSNNFGSYSNSKVDSLIEQLEQTFDQSERDDIAKQISQEVLDDNAYIFFANSKTSYIAKNGVDGIAVSPSEYYFITVDTDFQ
ncbi:MAG: ABC transporter substrate-binding protein [Coriobacteriales bacterium]|jgi:peptide/nickel transport system substrate-binding protein